MFKTSLFIILFLVSGFAYGQTSIKRIDSLIAVVRKTYEVDTSSRLLSIIQKESKAINYKDGMASYILLKGTDLYNRGKFDEALKLTYDGEKIVLSTNDNAKIAHLLALRGNCFNNLYFFEKSKQCLLEAKLYADKIKDDNARYFSLGRIYRIMAANYSRLAKVKDIDSALFYQQKSYQIQSKIKGEGANLAGVIIQAAAIGQLLFEKGQIDSAKYYFEKSLSLADKNKLSKYTFEGLMGLGDIDSRANRLNNALNHYLRALQQSEKVKNANHRKIAHQALAKTYEKIGDNIKSLQYLKKYVEIADSLAQADKHTSRIPIAYIIKERENLLQKENQLRNVYLIFSVCIAILSILIIVILYKNITTARKNNKALNAINKLMAEQNEYLHQTLQSLEESHKENNRVMQIITHDLRSPMAAIVGLSGFMMAEHDLSEEDLEIITLINTSGQDSLKFISDILEKETKEAALKKEPVDLYTLLVYCTTQLQYKANDKNQIIKLTGSTITLSLDREKIWRVINNLITNAIKFSTTGASIDVSLSKQDNKVIIAVKDSGIGIPEHLKDKIFSAANESKREGTGGEKSFGLGLAISKQIVEAHHGTLRFESQLNKGTIFFIELPLH